MKVILIEDVKNVGKKGDIIEANDGYARNCLLKKKLGVEATGANMNDLKLKNNNDAKIAREQLEAAKDTAEKLGDMAVTLSIKAGEGGKTFGSVSSKEIAAAYKEQYDMDIDKKKIQLPEAIRSFGTYDVPIKLHPQVTATLKVKVTEKK